MKLNVYVLDKLAGNKTMIDEKLEYEQQHGHNEIIQELLNAEQLDFSNPRRKKRKRKKRKPKL